MYPALSNAAWMFSCAMALSHKNHDAAITLFSLSHPAGAIMLTIREVEIGCDLSASTRRSIGHTKLDSRFLLNSRAINIRFLRPAQVTSSHRIKSGFRSHHLVSGKLCRQKVTILILQEKFFSKFS